MQSKLENMIGKDAMAKLKEETTPAPKPGPSALQKNLEPISEVVKRPAPEPALKTTAEQFKKQLEEGKQEEEFRPTELTPALICQTAEVPDIGAVTEI